MKYVNIQDVIKTLTEKHGLTQADIADFVGCGTVSVSIWKTRGGIVGLTLHRERFHELWQKFEGEKIELEPTTWRKKQKPIEDGNVIVSTLKRQKGKRLHISKLSTEAGFKSDKEFRQKISNLLDNNLITISRGVVSLKATG